MFKCVVGLYGPPFEIAGRHEVEIELPEEASLSEVVAKLRHEIPELEGRVILSGKDKLTNYYTFNINGRFYHDNKEIRIRKGYRIGLLPFVSGG